jgi:hypothetical protein
MRALLLTACAATLAPCAWAADESYTITIKRHPAAGKSFTVRELNRATDRTKLTDATGKVLLDGRARQEVREEEYTETTLEGGEPAPKKFKRFYRKARFGRGKGAVAEPWEGKVILYELKDGKHHASVEGKDELPEKELAKLAQEADGRLKDNFNTLIVPARAVKVGETWAIPGKTLARLPFSDLDPARSKGEATLVKAYKKGGRQWGTLHIKGALALTRLHQMQFDPPGSAVFEGTFDTPIDGSSALGLTQSRVVITGKGKVEQKGMRYAFEMNTEVEGKRERVD